MHNRVPEECFLTLPAEITPDLARTYSDKINLLLQVQLLGKSVSDLDSALRLMLDLAQELVAFDRGTVLWVEEDDKPAELRASKGFPTPPPLPPLRGLVFADDTERRPRPLMASRHHCPYAPIQSLLEKIGADSLLSLPLYLDERVTGALQLFRSDPPTFSDSEAHLVRVFTLTFEGVIDNLLQSNRPKAYSFLDRPTGLFNRRYFEQQLERELDRARRHSESASVLIVEVEGLEQVRQEQGHAAGEAVLQETARRLGHVCRKSDTLARYQDEQFAVILPRTGKTDMGMVAQRVFGALGGPFLTGLTGGDAVSPPCFNLSAVTYPEDTFSATSAMEGCEEGLTNARNLPRQRRFYQPPFSSMQSENDDILDSTRMGLLGEPMLESSRLLKLFARMCLDVVPADRVSVMVREGNELVIQVAYGFDAQEEVVRSSRVRLDEASISAWVAKHREPLLVQDSHQATTLPRLGGAAYRSESFFSYPLLSGEELAGVVHFSNPSDGTSFTPEQVAAFAPLAEVIAGYLHRDADFSRTQEAFLRDALFSLVDVAESQVPGMEQHSQSVARLAEGTARRLGLTVEERDRLQVSARLHNLGYVTYRTRVLSEPRALSPRERALTQRHPLLGWKFLEEVPLRCVDREAILYHHEREDGSGYLHKPGTEVPVAAKVLAVADVYTALTSPRPYRPAISREQAVSYLNDHRESLFDGGVVDAFLGALEENGASPA